MSGDDDHRSWDDRKKSFSELDKQRREGRSSGDRPRGPVSEARLKAASDQYRKSLDSMFTGSQGGAEGEGLANAIRDAQGTPGLAEACRAYRDAVGMPDDPTLLSAFLDAGDAALVVAGLEALVAGRASGRLEIGRGLRSQLRMLVDGPDADAADLAEELLEDA